MVVCDLVMGRNLELCFGGDFSLPRFAVSPSHLRRPSSVPQTTEMARSSLTLRAISIGLLIGFLTCSPNVYFGLQTGYAVGVAMPASLIELGLSKLWSSLSNPLTPEGNVLIATIAGGMCFTPVNGSLVGVIPVLEYLVTEEENGPVKLNGVYLILWACGLVFFGAVCALPLRKYFIADQRLPFPSATATAFLIATIRATPKDLNYHTNDERGINDAALDRSDQGPLLNPSVIQETLSDEKDWRAMLNALWLAACGSGLVVSSQYDENGVHKC